MSLRRWAHRAAQTLCLLAVATAAARADAREPSDQTDPNEDAAQARRKAADAERLFAQRDYVGALHRLEEALALAPNPKLKYDLGRVQKALGHEGPALSAFERYLVEVPDAPAGRRKAALQQAESLRPRLGTIEITCDVEGAEILIDGESQGRTPQAQSIWVSPGAHVIVVKPPQATFGYTERIEASAGTTARVGAPLAQLMAAVGAGAAGTEPARAGLPARTDTPPVVAAPLPPVSVVAHEAAPVTPWLRRAAWGAAGGAVLGLVVAGFAEHARVEAVDHFNDFRGGSRAELCTSTLPDRGGGPCASYYDDTVQARHVTVGALGVSAALATTALVTFLISGSQESPARADAAVPAVALGPRDVVATWRF
jgi:hypothetical protein